MKKRFIGDFLFFAGLFGVVIFVTLYSGLVWGLLAFSIFLVILGPSIGGGKNKIAK